MSESKCPSPDQLAAYYHGNVAPDFSRWVVGHICECEKCSAALKAMRAASRAEVTPAAAANATITINGGGVPNRSMQDSADPSLAPPRSKHDDTRAVRSEAQDYDTRELSEPAEAKTEEARLKADRAEQPKPAKKPPANTVADVRSLAQNEHVDRIVQSAKQAKRPAKSKPPLDKARANATVEINMPPEIAEEPTLDSSPPPKKPKPPLDKARANATVEISPAERPKELRLDSPEPSKSPESAKKQEPPNKATDTTAIPPGDSPAPPKSTDTTAIDPQEAAKVAGKDTGTAATPPRPEAKPSEAKPEKPTARQQAPGKQAPATPKAKQAPAQSPTRGKPAQQKPPGEAAAAPAERSSQPQPAAAPAEGLAPKKKKKAKKLPPMGLNVQEADPDAEEAPPDMRAADQELSKMLESGPSQEEAARLNEAITEFGDALDKARLVPWNELEEFIAELKYPQVDPQALARELVKAEMITGYQAGMLLNGRGSELLVGEYCILEMLADSGLGTRYIAMHRETRNPVALKVVDAETIARRQSAQVKTLAGEHLDRVLEEGNDRSGAFVVTEYLPGGDLTQSIRHRVRLPTDEAARAALDAARGLQQAARQNVVHGNVCPTNLVLDEEGKVHVTDFGWDGLRPIPDLPEDDEADLASSGTAMGPPSRVALLAPEILNGKSGTTVASDIYSLGITLAYLVMGVPWNLNKRLDDKADALPNIKECMHQAPRMLQMVLRKMCSKDPRQRFKSYDEVVDALEKLLDPEQHEALEKSLAITAIPNQQVAQASGGKGKLLIAVAVAVLVVAVLAAWMLGIF